MILHVPPYKCIPAPRLAWWTTGGNQWRIDFWWLWRRKCSTEVYFNRSLKRKFSAALTGSAMSQPLILPRDRLCSKVGQTFHHCCLTLQELFIGKAFKESVNSLSSPAVPRHDSWTQFKVLVLGPSKELSRSQVVLLLPIIQIFVFRSSFAQKWVKHLISFTNPLASSEAGNLSRSNIDVHWDL